jgi:hypothetical protein
VQKTLADLAKELQRLEIDICQSMLSRTDNADLLDESKSARKLVTDTSDALRGEISAHFLKHNTAERGIIAWLKPGIPRRFSPAPIHLKPALQYLMDNNEFSSTSYDVCDIFTDDVKTQYGKIVTRLAMPSNPPG